MQHIGKLNPPLQISAALSKDSTTTYEFQIVEIYSLIELVTKMNSYAVCMGNFQNGHRHSRQLKSLSKIYFIDIDVPAKNNELAYYKIIEKKLIANNISFVSVPSRSADQYPYKRHIAILLSHALPTGSIQFDNAAKYILSSLNIDEDKIDHKVSFNRISFLQPAKNNSNFTDYMKKSSFFLGKPFPLPLLHRSQNTNIDANNLIDSNQLIKFEDGSTMNAFYAKQIISSGISKNCHCPSPTHIDKTASASFYHNENGSVHIYCHKCRKTFKISKNYLPKEPSIPHSAYNYSIIINNSNPEKIRTLISEIGIPSKQLYNQEIWYFSPESITDIYQLFLAKSYLINAGYNLSKSTPNLDKNIIYKNINILKSITKNHTLPGIYIPINKEMSPDKYVYIYMKRYIYQYEYLFAEAAIFTIFQNRIDPNRDFEATCNLGLAYFEYILKMQKEQMNLKQKDKSFPMKLTKYQKKISNKKRTKSTQYTKNKNISERQKKILNLLKTNNFIKKNGKINKTYLSNILNISRPTLDKDLKLLGKI